MKLPSTNRLQDQDYPKKYQDLISGMFTILNRFMDVITQALSKRLNFNDNFDCLDVSITVTAPVTSLKVKNTQGGTMGGCQVWNVTNITNPQEVITSVPFVQFANGNDSQIVIKSISNLTAGNRYSLRMIFIR